MEFWQDNRLLLISLTMLALVAIVGLTDREEFYGMFAQKPSDQELINSNLE